MKLVTIKYFVALIVSAIVVSSVFAGTASKYNFDVTKTEELRARDGLPNFFKKLKNGENVKVGYIGGSITNGGMWRDKSLTWLQQEYPKANITQINAAIGGKGPDFGATRIKNHLLQHEPDMVFIEFRVNNGGVFKGRALEGMIPQIWQHNPNIEICIVYTIASWMKKDIAQGKQPSAGVYMEPVANHYGITSIEFGLEVMTLLKEDKLVFKKGDSAAKGKILFSKDGTHPLEAGHDIYMKVLARSLKAIENHGNVGPNQIPAPLNDKAFSNADLLPVSQANFKGEWSEVDLGDGAAINDNFTDKNNGTKALFGKAMKTSKVGDSFTIKWNGFLLGLTTTLAKKGAIQIEVSTDGGPAKLVDLISPKGKLSAKYKFLDEVPAGKHSTTIKVVKLASDIELKIGQFLVVR